MQVSFLNFQLKILEKGIFVFWREDGYQLDHSSWSNICIQPVWEVQVSYEVVQLLSQINSLTVFNDLHKSSEFSRSYTFLETIKYIHYQI